MLAFVPSSLTTAATATANVAASALTSTVSLSSSPLSSPSFLLLADSSDSAALSVVSQQATILAEQQQQQQQPEVVFEPVIPDATTLIGFGAIAVLSAVAVYVWANQVVPVSRTNLAISKKSGVVKEYLDGLEELQLHQEQQAAGELPLQVTAPVSTTNAITTDDGETVTMTESRKDDTANNRALERWLFTDWLQQREAKRSGDRTAGRQKEPAIPILKNAKWNSGDNPVLAASALIGIGVLISAVTERAFSVIAH